MSDTLVMLQLEHRSYWRILDLLEHLLDKAEAGKSVDTQRIAQIFEYFSEYPDRCHHPKEDLVFGRLKVVSPEDAERVGDLLGNHEGLAELTRRAADVAQQAQRAGGDIDREQLNVLREFCEGYRGHIRDEEQHFIPASLEQLSHTDLDLIDFSMFDATDPIFDEAAEARFASLRRAILESTDPD